MGATSLGKRPEAMARTRLHDRKQVVRCLVHENCIVPVFDESAREIDRAMKVGRGPSLYLQAWRGATSVAAGQ